MSDERHTDPQALAPAVDRILETARTVADAAEQLRGHSRRMYFPRDVGIPALIVAVLELVKVAFF